MKLTKKRMIELCEIMRDGIVKQGRYSVSEEGAGCKYRIYAGYNEVVAKCAIGHLIPDEHYSENLENLTVTDEEVLEALYEAKVIDRSEDEGVQELQDQFLQTAQAIHDNLAVCEANIEAVSREFDRFIKVIKRKKGRTVDNIDNFYWETSAK